MLRKLLLITFLIFFVISSWVAVEAISFLTQAPSESFQEVIFEVKAGSFSRTAYKLRDAGLINNPKYFIWYAKLRGDTTRLQKGEYRLSKNYSPKQILDELISGNVVKYPVTVPEGYNIFDIANLLEQQGLVSAEDFLRVARDSSYASSLVGSQIPSLEGFLFPETYHFSKSEGAKAITQAMYVQFKKVYDRILREPSLLQLPMIEHVTLASIIEKETGAEGEREKISSVFHNRLKKKMRLQSDPTILYGIMIEDNEWKQNIRKSDISRPTAYNTYTIRALPPAPIANPGEEALRAALNPESTNYLYFVSRNDGTHVFTSTYKDHLKAVRDFQLNPKAREGKSWRDLKQQ